MTHAAKQEKRKRKREEEERQKETDQENKTEKRKGKVQGKEQVAPAAAQAAYSTAFAKVPVLVLPATWRGERLVTHATQKEKHQRKEKQKETENENEKRKDNQEKGRAAGSTKSADIPQGYCGTEEQMEKAIERERPAQAEDAPPLPLLPVRPPAMQPSRTRRRGRARAGTLKGVHGCRFQHDCQLQHDLYHR